VVLIFVNKRLDFNTVISYISGMMPESFCESKPEYILCAAIHYDDGLNHIHQPKNISSGFVVAGRRHHNCIRTFAILKNHFTGELPVTEQCLCKMNLGKLQSIQGFITSKDRFLNRAESYDVAVASGQIKPNDDENKAIFSEELW